MRLSSVNYISTNNFHDAWYKAIREVLRNGVDITFGTEKDLKYARDSCQLIEMTGGAINQIIHKEIHPQYPFRMIDQYCEEFTWDFLEAYSNLPEQNKFAYLYFQRLVGYECGMDDWINQLGYMRMDLERQILSNILSNRSQSITWQPGTDLDTNSPPCLQKIWVRYCDDNLVDVHFDWRSRDLYTAWQSNIIALVGMLNREVIGPNDCQIARVVDYSDSLHIYRGDIEMANKVNAVEVWSR